MVWYGYPGIVLNVIFCDYSCQIGTHGINSNSSDVIITLEPSGGKILDSNSTFLSCATRLLLLAPQFEGESKKHYAYENPVKSHYQNDNF